MIQIGPNSAVMSPAPSSGKGVSCGARAGELIVKSTSDIKSNPYSWFMRGEMPQQFSRRTEKQKPRYQKNSGAFNWCRRDESNTRPSHYECFEGGRKGFFGEADSNKINGLARL
jgi:hypothetical protein